MSDILKKYEQGGTPTVDEAKLQSGGGQSVAANWFDDYYQKDFTTGAGTPGTDPAGNFTDNALEHYDQEVTELANSHHKSNASDSESHYTTKHLNAKGIVYQSIISEK